MNQNKNESKQQELSPEQLQEVVSEQLQELSPEQLQKLLSEQLQELSPESPELSPEQLQKLLSEHILEKLQERLQKLRLSQAILKQNFQSKSTMHSWMHRFLRDEEKAAILIEYRISWYGDKPPNNWIHFQVWLKTLHHLFYEVWFKEQLDKITSFQIRTPRW